MSFVLAIEAPIITRVSFVGFLIELPSNKFQSVGLEFIRINIFEPV